MQKTTNIQEVKEAIERDQLVKMHLDGKNWIIHDLAQRKRVWLAHISHPDWANKRIERLQEEQEFIIYPPRSKAHD